MRIKTVADLLSCMTACRQQRSGSKKHLKSVMRPSFARAANCIAPHFITSVPSKEY